MNDKPKVFLVIMRNDEDQYDKVSSVFMNRESAKEYQKEKTDKYDETIVTSRFLKQ